MSETINAISQASISKILTLTTDYQPLFSKSIENGTVFVSMMDGIVNVGTVNFIIGGGLAKTDVCTGGLYFDQNVDNTRFPISYNVSDGVKSYTLRFSYNGDTKKIEIAKEVIDPDVTIVFNGLYRSATESFTDSVYKVDKIVENAVGLGTTFDNSVSLNGGVEMNNLPSDTIVFNDTVNIAYTNVSSRATRVGKQCTIMIKASLTVSGALVSAKSAFTFFSVTPTNKYANANVVVGIVSDTSTHDIGTVYNDPNTADFYITLPRSLNMGSTSTVIATISYVV
jgi:hypothetical protein